MCVCVCVSLCVLGGWWWGEGGIRSGATRAGQGCSSSGHQPLLEGLNPRPERPLPKVRHNEGWDRAAGLGVPQGPERAAGSGAGGPLAGVSQTEADLGTRAPQRLDQNPRWRHSRLRPRSKARLLVNESALLELEVEELLQGTGAAAVLAVRGVVLAAVGDDPLQVSYKELPGHIVAAAQPLCHGLQVWAAGEKGTVFRGCTAQGA